MFDSLRKSIAQMISPRPQRMSAFDRLVKKVLTEAARGSPAWSSSGFGLRMYHGARPSRLTAGWNPTTGSADSELKMSHRVLRDRSRSLVRDAGYAKRARVI